MSENDRIVLKTVLESNQAEIAPELTESDYFEIFSAEQVLKEYDLNYDEIQSGIVGGGNDGGIDSIHVFVNGSLIQEDTEIGYDNFDRNLTIDLCIVQAKKVNSFGETPIQKFDTTFRELFYLGDSLDGMQAVYNEQLLSIVEKFRTIWTTHAAKLPKLNISFSYVSIGDEPNQNVARLVAMLQATVKGLFNAATFGFSFVGAADLLQLARQEPTVSYPLRLSENPISSGEQSFICLVNLVDYYNFICDEENHLNRYIFEANVRDYQGLIQVNQGIQHTLSNRDDNEFWWLNNGITMIVNKAVYSGNTLQVENPMIVNGMQTSFEIHKFFSTQESPEDPRNILIRVIGLTEMSDELDTTNKVIKATNSQTGIQSASLRATDEVQKAIEEYILHTGYYYDRRKNYYRNQRKPINQIISITYLAQCIISIVLKRPNDARARPSTLIREDTDYLHIFDPEYPMPLYLQCIKIMQHVEDYLRRNITGANSTEILNYKFHLAMFATLFSLNNPNATPTQISDLDLAELSDELLRECFDKIIEVYSSFSLGNYLASKDRSVSTNLLTKLEESTFEEA